MAKLVWRFIGRLSANDMKQNYDLKNTMAAKLCISFPLALDVDTKMLDFGLALLPCRPGERFETIGLLLLKTSL